MNYFYEAHINSWFWYLQLLLSIIVTSVFEVMGDITGYPKDQREDDSSLFVLGVTRQKNGLQFQKAIFHGMGSDLICYFITFSNEMKIPFIFYCVPHY